MRLIGLAVVLTVGLVLAPLAAEAQSAGNARRIGYLGPPPSTGGLLEAFQQGLRELGYIEGRNIIIEYRYTGSGRDMDTRLPLLAAELVQLKPEVLVVSIDQAALAAKNATTTIPIVMVNVGDPVGHGLIASLARPGGNITGRSRMAPESTAKSLEILKEAVPRAVRVAVLSNPRNSLHPELLKNAKPVAGLLGVQLEIVEARTPNELEGAFSSMARQRIGALLVLPDGMFYFNRTQIADLALRNRVPSMFSTTELAEGGWLMAYSPSSIDNYRRAARHVDKILKGAKPADLPVEQPTKFELLINLKTAKALGLTIPQSLLARADEIIQ
jgi:putative tryptophan/tyrosine transport system substrate-binding protein